LTYRRIALDRASWKLNSFALNDMGAIECIPYTQVPNPARHAHRLNTVSPARRLSEASNLRASTCHPDFIGYSALMLGIPPEFLPMETGAVSGSNVVVE
jgi:hypothetical protein